MNDKLRKVLDIKKEEEAEAIADAGIIDGGVALKEPIGKEQIAKATMTLNKYKEGKARLEQKIIGNEEWYKMRHWEQMRGGYKTVTDSNGQPKQVPDEIKPTSAWLFNCIANKHADAMDNFPSPNILPREAGDKPEAKRLTSIIPVVLDQNDFEKTYSDAWNYKLKSGTAVYGAFWDSDKLNGLGDISIKKLDILNLFWESGVTDIQDSKNFFNVELVDNDILEEQYPQLKNKLSQANITVAQYSYDDAVDTSNKSAVIDWYYKKMNNGKTILHYCKFVNDTVLFATENQTEAEYDEEGNMIAPPMSETGLYDHGKYPFVFDPLFQVEGTPCGYSYIDIAKDSQEYIDRLNQCIIKNALVNAKPRYFAKNNSNVSEEEYADQTKDFVHFEGNFDDSIVPIEGAKLDSVYINVLNNKIDEMKETTGNRDISTGGTSSGVTAASAIAAMQEAGSKLSRDANKQSYRAYKELILMVIELIRQFYDLPRSFRILGEEGAEEFIDYSNANLVAQPQTDINNEDMGSRLPLFDIEVTAQKQSPYTKMAQNELALQFFGAGFFNPELADQALACLDMMDFDRKDFVVQKIQQNGGMYQMMLQMQQSMAMMAAQLDALQGGNSGQQMMAMSGGITPQAQGGQVSAEAINKAENDGESPITRNARERVAESTSPN